MAAAQRTGRHSPWQPGRPRPQAPVSPGRSPRSPGMTAPARSPTRVCRSTTSRATPRRAIRPARERAASGSSSRRSRSEYRPDRPSGASGYHPVMSAGAGRSRISAGILLYRRINGPLDVLLAHPGGPFFVHKDEGHWTIPKGEIDVEESETALLAVARREFAEETGQQAPAGPGLTLGSIIQKGGKIVHAWAFEGDLDPSTASSNTFELA